MQSFVWARAARNPIQAKGLLLGGLPPCKRSAKI